MILLTDTSKWTELRNMTLIITMFMGFLRASEVTNLKRDDVWFEEVDGRRVLFVLIEKSKTDQERRGETIVLGGDDESAYCILNWMELWLECVPDGCDYLFPVKKGGGWVQMGSKTPNHRVKDLLRRIGVDPAQYGSHSCRKGGCSKAAAAGVELRVLKRHGRWKSWAVFLYIHDSVKQKLEVTSALYK